MGAPRGKIKTASDVLNWKRFVDKQFRVAWLHQVGCFNPLRLDQFRKSEILFAGTHFKLAFRKLLKSFSCQIIEPFPVDTPMVIEGTWKTVYESYKLSPEVKNVFLL